MRRGSITERAVAAGLALACSGTLFLAPATPALAEDTDLEALQEKAIAAGDTYQQAQDKLERINAQVADNQSKVEELESQLPGQQEKAALAIKAEYKLSQEQGNLISILLESQDFSDFVTKLYYMDSVTKSNLGDIEALSKASSELHDTQAQLESAQQAAQQESDAAKQAYEDAQQTAAAARKKAMEEAAARQAAYEAQQAAGQQDPTVAEVQKSEGTQKDAPKSDTAPSQQQTGASDNASDSGQRGTATETSGDSPSPTNAPSANTSSDAQKSNSTSSANSSKSPSSSSTSTSKSPNANSSAGSSASYTYVMASMYGEGDGFMYGTTASGDTVTPTSMGVAMKTMPLGTVIEISYNGKTVRAVVNDRGPYVGNRQMDLQPAVAHALGFDGVGQIGYRVVG